MKTIIYPGLYAILLVFLYSAIVRAELDAMDNPQPRPVTSWNEMERAALRRLSISELTPSPELRVNQVASNPAAAELGQKIFFDTRFSINGKVSCASCHKPKLYFTDGRRTAKGLAVVKRNTPTLVGINQSNWLFLDGRADSLWSQALGPLEHHMEHGSSRGQVAQIVYTDRTLRKAYEQLFGKMPLLSNQRRFPEYAGPVKDRDMRRAWRGMTKKDQEQLTTVFVNIGKAIAAYELMLNPAPARFDQFAGAVLANDPVQSTILNKDEVAGLKLFINKANCIICHNGPMFSDFEFHNIATPPVNVKNYDWGRYRGVNQLLKSKFNCHSQYNDDPAKTCDELKYIIREKAHTVGLFRTPTLRNITKTAPYMHAGQYETIKEVLQHYTDPPSTKIGQSDLIPIPINLDNNEMAQLEAFLSALQSDINADPRWLRPPE